VAAAAAAPTRTARFQRVSANVEFPFPGRLVNGAVAAAVGVDREADPWLPARSVWPLLDVVEAWIAWTGATWTSSSICWHHRPKCCLSLWLARRPQVFLVGSAPTPRKGVTKNGSRKIR